MNDLAEGRRLSLLTGDNYYIYTTSVYTPFSWRFCSSTVVNVSDNRPLTLSKADFISTGKLNLARTTWTNRRENESHLGVDQDQQCNADQKMDGFSL